MGSNISLENTLIRRALVVSLLVLMFLISFASILNDSPTIDEPIHVYAGYTHLRTGDLAINPEHPPLMKEIAALPLLFLDLAYVEPAVGPPAVQRDYASFFFFGGGNNPDTLMLLSRLMMILVVLAGALMIYLFACSLFGYAAGILALALTAISPVFLSYGSLVTFDVACAAGMMLALYCFWRFLRCGKKRWLIFSGLSLGIALLTQNTALALIPILLVLAMIHAFMRRKEGSTSAIGASLIRYVAIVLIAISLIGVYYGIHTVHMSEKEIAQTIDINLPNDSLGYKMVQGLSHVSPPLALFSISFLRNYYFNKTEGPGLLIYLNNRSQGGPFWYYFIEAFMLKTPLGVLVLLLLALIFYPWRKLQLSDFFILIPVLMLIVFAAFVRAQFGIKYLIPLYTFLYILIARGIINMFSVLKRKNAKRIAAAAVAFLLIMSAISMLMVVPHLIPYFNLSIGSRDNGYHYLAEQNVDWGQDLKYLADFVHREGITEMQSALYDISLFQTNPQAWSLPNYYMPRCNIRLFDGNLYPGWFALSTSYRKYILYWQPDLASYLEGVEPYAIINHSILIYYLEESWPGGDLGS